MKLEIREHAQIDIIEAWSYYEGEQDGLGARFLDRLDSLFEKIAANPQHYSFIDLSSGRRDAVLTPFPYVVVFEVLPQAVVVYRVFNTYQNTASL